MEYTRKEKTILYCINILNQLAEKGLVTNGGWEIAPEGINAICGFEPTKKEIEEGGIVSSLLRCCLDLLMVLLLY